MFSTVDSGNLLASLWVLAQGCEDAANAGLLGVPCLQGLADTLAALARECASDSVGRWCRSTNCVDCCAATCRDMN